MDPKSLKLAWVSLQNRCVDLFLSLTSAQQIHKETKESVAVIATPVKVSFKPCCLLRFILVSSEL